LVILVGPLGVEPSLGKSLPQADARADYSVTLPHFL